jgi:hypothetical protein
VQRWRLAWTSVRPSTPPFSLAVLCAAAGLQEEMLGSVNQGAWSYQWLAENHNGQDPHHGLQMAHQYHDNFQ